MKTTRILLLAFILLSTSGFAQLAVGDIAFIGYNTDSGPTGPDDHSFSFITLTDIPGSEIIYFTEEGWNDDTDVWVGNSEGHIKWTAPGPGVSCGTIIYITESGASTFTVTGGGTATLDSGSGWSLSAGDQVLAYQAATAEPATIPTFISGVHGNDGDAFALDPVTLWDEAATIGAGGSRSCLPFGLTNGVDCIALFIAPLTEQDNAKYNGTLTGTSTALRALINNRLNWITDNGTAYNISPGGYASPSVTCVAPCTDPTIPTATSAPGIICDGNSALLTISGTKNDATAWHVYTGSCGGTLVGTTAGSTIIVVPTPPSTTYFIRGEGGCITPGSCGTITVTTTAREDASFSYDAAAYCVDDSDPTPTITGVGGGTFTGGGGLVINASTGAIDVSASTPGTYTVNYNTPGLCDGDEDVSVTINGLDDASFDYAATAYCVDASDPTPTITGLGGGTFSAGGGLTINASTGAIDVSASTPGFYTVTYTTAGTCPNSATDGLTIHGLDDPSFSYDAAAYCADDSDPTPTITGLGGGSFSAGGGLTINASTGAIDLSTSTSGTYTITYTTAGFCPNSTGVSVTVNALDDASFTYDAAAYCVDDSDPTPTITGLAGGTFSSGGGLTINASTGAIDVSVSTPGTYTVTYTTAGTCPNSADVSVTINAIDDAAFTYDAAAYCADDSDPTPTVTGLGGGTFSSGGGLSINASTGAIDVSASTPGTYTVTYTTAGSCPNSSSVSVTINALDDASFTYAAAAYCVDDSDPTPTITGLGGGSFSAGGGLSINASTGAIDVSASTPGTYTVTYTTAGTCPNSSSVSVTINGLDDASFTYDAAAYCADDSDPTPTITGLGGGSFSAGAGLSINASTGAIDVSASTPGTYTVTYTTAGSCPNSSSVSVTINALDDASFSYDAASYCVSEPDPTPTITGLAGGTFSAGGGLSINASTGVIDVSASTPGAYTITYTTAGTCPNTSSVSVTITSLDDASFTYDAAAYCVDDSDPTPTITGVGGGTFSAVAGLVINASTGAIDVSASTPGTYTVTYSTIGVCANSSNVSVTINALDDPSFTYDAAAYCADDSDPTPTITGLGGGSFSAGGGLSINASTGAIDVSASTPGTYTVTYTTAGSCPNASSVSVTINALDDALFTYDAAAYCVDDSDPTPTITGLAGGSFSSGGGLSINASTGAIDVSVSTPGTYTVTYTTTGTCPNSSGVSVTINAIDDASFTYGAASYCVDDTDPTPTITGLAGGSFSSGGGLTINASTGAIDVSASTPGTYTVTYTTAGSCPNASSVSVTINALDDASFTYDAAAYCVDDADPTPTIASPGGVFFAAGGLILNISTGEIDVSGSTPGLYLVTYATSGPCVNASGVFVTINALDDASFTYDAAAYCADDTDPTPTITGLGGGTFSAGGGLTINASTGAIDVSTSTPGTYTVTYTTAGTCTNTSGVTVTVNALDDASFTYDSPSYCLSETDPTPTITGLAGGTFTAGAGLVINAATGELDVSASTPGSYTVTYTTSGTCPNSSSVAVSITSLDDASFSYDAAIYCPNGADPTPTITGVPGGTFSSGAGLVINAATGEIDLDASTEGTYTVTYTTIGVCTNSSDQTVTVEDDTDPVPADAVLPDVTAECEVTSLTDPIVTDNCGGIITITNDASLPITDQGTTTVTWTYEDENGNITTQTQDVVLDDITPPTPDDADLPDVTAECEVTSLTDPTATDNCGGPVTATSDAILPITDQGTTTITWTYEDENGNEITQTQDVVIDDITGPTPDVDPLDDVTAECEVTSLTDPTATDNCGGPVTVTSDAVLPITDQGTTTITWTYEDENGNISTQTQDIVIDDITPPTILDCVADFTETPNTPVCEAFVFWVEPTVTDNCAGVTMTSTHSPGEIFPLGITTVIYTATDIGGNETTCSFDITVESDLNLTVVIIDEEMGADGEIDLTVTGGVSPYVYDWDIDGTGDFDDTEDLTDLIAGTYVIEVMDTIGCTATLTVEVVLSCFPLDVEVSETTLCANELLTLDGTSETGGTITWDMDVTNGVPFMPGVAGIITYTATSDSDEDCPFTVDIEVLAIPTVIASAGDGSFCDGEPVVLSAGGDADNYSWDPIDLDPPIGVTTYTLTGIFDETGCMNTATVDVTVHALPTVVANAESAFVCIDNEVILFGTGATSYLWDAGVIDNEPFDAIEIGTFTYTVIGTDDNSCEDSDQIEITVVEPITITYDVINEMGGADGEIDITVTGGLPPYTFDWDNDGLGDLDDDEDLTDLSYGFYEVYVIGEAGCESNEIIYVDTQVGIGEEDEVTLQVYPNPVKDNLTVQLDGTFTYTIYSLDGKLILAGQSVNQETIYVGDVADGTYLIEIRNENGVKRTQFVKN
ncbi:MAG: HYR domain-containing protein [Crocinitomix sp.]|nr:HYR domain-containing protein [Crocinitomix sp.]